MAKAGKTGVYEGNPNPQTVRFGGRWTNLSAIAKELTVDASHVSRIFSGKTNPSLKCCLKLADLLDMTIGEFVDAVEERKKALDIEAAGGRLARYTLMGEYPPETKIGAKGRQSPRGLITEKDIKEAIRDERQHLRLIRSKVIN